MIFLLAAFRDRRESLFFLFYIKTQTTADFNRYRCGGLRPRSQDLRELLSGGMPEGANSLMRAVQNYIVIRIILSVFGPAGGVIKGVCVNKLSETTETLTNKASNILNRFVETLAVMIVTSCIIPLAVLLFFLSLGV